MITEVVEQIDKEISQMQKRLKCQNSGLLVFNERLLKLKIEKQKFLDADLIFEGSVPKIIHSERIVSKANRIGKRNKINSWI